MLAIALLSAAIAADSTFAGADPSVKASEAPTSTVSAELGGVWVSGNTSTFTLNGALRGAYGWDRNRLRLDVAANIGQSYVDADGNGHVSDDERAAGRVESARRYLLETRYDRYVGERDSVYALAGGLIDPFAGYDTRTHAQLGFSRRFLMTESTRLVGELGGDVAREDFVAGVEPGGATVVAARALGGLEHRFNPSVTFAETLEVYENVLAPDDLRVISHASVTSGLAKGLSLRISHQVLFDNVPVEGFRKVDQTTMATFVATLVQSQ